MTDLASYDPSSILNQAHSRASKVAVPSSTEQLWQADDHWTYALVEGAGGGEYVAYPAYPPVLDRYGRAPLCHMQGVQHTCLAVDTMQFQAAMRRAIICMVMPQSCDTTCSMHGLARRISCTNYKILCCLKFLQLLKNEHKGVALDIPSLRVGLPQRAMARARPTTPAMATTTGALGTHMSAV